MHDLALRGPHRVTSPATRPASATWRAARGVSTRRRAQGGSTSPARPRPARDVAGGGRGAGSRGGGGPRVRAGRRPPRPARSHHARPSPRARPASRPGRGKRCVRGGVGARRRLHPSGAIPPARSPSDLTPPRDLSSAGASPRDRDAASGARSGLRGPGGAGLAARGARRSGPGHGRCVGWVARGVGGAWWDRDRDRGAGCAGRLTGHVVQGGPRGVGGVGRAV